MPKHSSFDLAQVISYAQMCTEEDARLQRGMNFRHKMGYSIFLMSQRPDAPYSDRVEDVGRVLIYEGHDQAKDGSGIDPKLVDQPMLRESGILTENGKFFEAAMNYKNKGQPAELVKVYEKLKRGIWVYNGMFLLIDAWNEAQAKRTVFKFKLRMLDDTSQESSNLNPLEHSRLIPSAVKLEVWKRDGGRCVKCGSSDNLHFDHILPFSKGGTSLLAKNIQLLCARHNLAKSAKIE